MSDLKSFENWSVRMAVQTGLAKPAERPREIQNNRKNEKRRRNFSIPEGAAYMAD